MYLFSEEGDGARAGEFLRNAAQHDGHVPVLGDALRSVGTASAMQDRPYQFRLVSGNIQSVYELQAADGGAAGGEGAVVQQQRHHGRPQRVRQGDHPHQRLRAQCTKGDQHIRGQRETTVA